MSLNLSFGKTKSKESSNKVVDQTTTKFAPDWLTNSTQGMADRINKIASYDPASLVAKADPLQTKGAEMAGNLGSGPDWFGMAGKALGQPLAATTMTAGKAWEQPTIDKGSLLENLGAYMSPYTQQVVDSTMRDFDFNAAQQRSQQTLDMAGAGAFGGSGAALTRSMADDASARARATTIAGLRDQAFQTGASLSNSDAERRQKASIAAADAAAKGASLAEQQRQYDLSLAEQGRQFDANYNMDLAKTLAGFGTAQDANKRANIDSLFTAGGTMREIDGQNKTAELDLMRWYVDTFGSLPLDMFGGTRTQGTENTQSRGSSTSIGGGVTIPIPLPA